MMRRILAATLFVLFLWAVEYVFPQESAIYSQLNINTGKWENCAESEGNLRFIVCFPADAEPYRSTGISIVFTASTVRIPKIVFTDLNTDKSLIVNVGILGWSASKTQDHPIPQSQAAVPYRTPIGLTKIFARPKEDFIHLVIAAQADNGDKGRAQMRINFK